MYIDTRKNQEFLAMVYSLQNNKSNAASTPKTAAGNIIRETVYKAMDYRIWKPYYSLEPIKDIPRYSDGEVTTSSKNKNKGGRPRILTEQHCEVIDSMLDNGASNREIARNLGVVEGTIRNYKKWKIGQEIQ